MSDGNNVFQISGTILNGYSYRHLWSIIKQICAKTTIIFSKRGFQIRQTDTQDKVLISVDIMGHKLLDYKFIVIHEGKELEDVTLEVGVSTNEMLSCLSSCGRNHEFLFLIKDNKKMEYRLNGKQISQGTGSHMLYFLDVQDVSYEEPKFNRSEDNPNVTVPTNEFVGICKDIEKRQGKKMIITGYNSGFRLMAKRDNDEMILCNEFGTCGVTPSIGQKDKSTTLKITDGKSSEPVKQNGTGATTSGAKPVVEPNAKPVTNSGFGSFPSFGNSTNTIETFGMSSKEIAEKAITVADKLFPMTMNNDQKKLLTDVTTIAAEGLGKIINAPRFVTISIPRKPQGIITSFDINIIKIFGKMKQLCQQGTLSFYMETDGKENKPLKIVTSIHNYGTLKFYINSH